MITAKQMRESLDTKPFKPFRIRMSDGTHRDITHHDMAWVTKNTVEVGLNLDVDGFAEYVVRCAILHITSVEDLPEGLRSAREPTTKSKGPSIACKAA